MAAAIAIILYELAVLEDDRDASGKHFDNDYPKGTLRERGTFAEAHPDAYDETKIDKLINTTAKVLIDYVL